MATARKKQPESAIDKMAADALRRIKKQIEKSAERHLKEMNLKQKPSA